MVEQHRRQHSGTALHPCCQCPPQLSEWLLVCACRRGGGGVPRRLHIAPSWLGSPRRPRHDEKADAPLPAHLELINVSARSTQGSREASQQI